MAKKEKKESFFSEFKKFIARGNILDLAVAVIIGAAFGAIVTSLVNDIIMPLVSLAIGGISIDEWKIVIVEAAYDANGILVTAETAIRYGAFLMRILDFVIIAFCIFVIIKLVMRAQSELKKLKKEDCAEEPAPEEPAAPPAPTQEELLAEIRDLLKSQAEKE